MTPLIIGLIAGVVAGLIATLSLTYSYHAMKKDSGFIVLVATVVLSMLPRLYFSFGHFANSAAAPIYTLAWMVVILPGFLLFGREFGGRIFKRKKD